MAVNTVVRAYRELEVAGLVETRGRQGTFVAGPPSQTRQLAVEAAQAFLRRMHELGFGRAEAMAIVRHEAERAVEPGWGAAAVSVHYLVGSWCWDSGMSSAFAKETMAPGVVSYQLRWWPIVVPIAVGLLLSRVFRQGRHLWRRAWPERDGAADRGRDGGTVLTPDIACRCDL
jgi:hypothetical protein